jgi:peptidoglycan/xylan/chitin deacetylase (PgdA/CDA1 family)
LLAPYTQGIGVIFTLHHVRPEPEEPRAFAPNRILEVAPQFLDAVLDQVQEAGLDVIFLDQAVQRFARARDEMVSGADRIEQELGSRPIYFAFPYGDPVAPADATSRSHARPASRPP